MNYIFTANGKQYTPDGQTNVADVNEHNRQLDNAVLAEWAEQPDHFVGYLKHTPGHTACYVTTWLGITIATGHTYGRSRGFNRTELIHVRVHGTNGATYHGKGSGGEMIIRLHKNAKQK